MHLNKKNIRFPLTWKYGKFFNSDQKVSLKNIEKYYSELHKRCVREIYKPIEATHKEWISARVLLHVNTSLMRLLYLTETFYHSLKKFNSASVGVLIKGMTEIPLHIGFLVWVIAKHNTFKEIRKQLMRLSFGDKDQKTELTYRSKVTGKELYENSDMMDREFAKDNNSHNLFEILYKEGNAIGHHNFETREMFCGIMDLKKNTWYAKDRKELFKFYANNIFQYFLYCDAILGMTNIFLKRIDYYLDRLPEYFETEK